MPKGIHFKDIKAGNYDKSVERIICAAVWFKKFPIIKEIPSDLLRPYNCDCGIVFSGHRHPQCLHQAVAISGLRTSELGQEGDTNIQGFLTNLNRFVDRIEGAKIAIDNGQIKELKYGSRLFSEDLY